MSLRILLVEDEEEIADFVVRGLREEGFVVDRAADGDSGWHAMRTGRWDAVLLDWSLPGPDGLELLRRLRRADRTTPVPTIISASRSRSKSSWRACER
jgi:two-component system copper resistance phosphate regulon response regulator CusR